MFKMLDIISTVNLKTQNGAIAALYKPSGATTSHEDFEEAHS